MARPLDEAITDFIWRHLGAEHDAYMVVDRAYMPVATGGFNATLRDAARFALMIRDKGVFDDQRLVPADWLDAMLSASDKDRAHMSANAVYAKMPWSAYKNMWWILDAEAGEFCAVGVHGQVIYINRASDTVMVWYSSQPDASAAVSPHFLVKLDAARALAQHLTEGES
jgi:CubicO group peptidase (beta-lactamase class C family)